MGLKDFFKRWSKATDEDAIERSQLGIHEDYEAIKDDAAISRMVAGGAASEVARDELADD